MPHNSFKRLMSLLTVAILYAMTGISMTETLTVCFFS